MRISKENPYIFLRFFLLIVTASFLSSPSPSIATVFSCLLILQSVESVLILVSYSNNAIIIMLASYEAHMTAQCVWNGALETVSHCVAWLAWNSQSSIASASIVLELKPNQNKKTKTKKCVITSGNNNFSASHFCAFLQFNLSSLPLLQQLCSSKTNLAM